MSSAHLARWACALWILVALLSFVAPAIAGEDCEEEAPPALALECGETARGELPSGLSTQDYTFFGVLGQVVRIEVAPTGMGVGAWNPRLTLFDSLDPCEARRIGGGRDIELRLVDTASYRLRVSDSGGDGFGEFALRLHVIFPPTGILPQLPLEFPPRVCLRELFCAEATKGTTEAACLRDAYWLEAEADDLIQLHVIEGEGPTAWSPRIRIFDPLGNLFDASAVKRRIRVPIGGVWVVLVGDSDAAGSYSLRFDRLAPADRQCADTLVSGDVAMGSVSHAEEEAFHHLEGRAGDVWLVEVLTDEGTGAWAPTVVLLGPSGETVSAEDSDGRRKVFRIARDGDHTLVVRDGNGNGHGAFRLALHGLSPRDIQSARRARCGVPMQGRLLEAKDRALVHLDAEAGDVIDFAVRAVGAGVGAWAPTVSFYAPDGSPLRGDRSTGTLQVLETGSYTAEVHDGNTNGHGVWSLRLDWRDGDGSRCAQRCDPPPRRVVAPLRVEVVDGTTAAIREARDREALAGAAIAVRGLAADGLSRVLLRLRDLPADAAVRVRLVDECGRTPASGMGRLVEPGSERAGVELSIEPVTLASGERCAFVLVEAPCQLERDDNDRDAVFRELLLRVEGGGLEGESVVPVRVYRPPLLLLHGLAGRASNWQFRTLVERRHVYAHDYHDESGAPILENVRVVRRAVASALESFRSGGSHDGGRLAAQRVDVAAHSLGAILTRLYVADLDGSYRRPDNRGLGDVRRFVAIAGPHRGSPVAEVLAFIVDTPVVGALFDLALESYGLDADGGAVHDLTPGAMAGVPPARVPTHVVYGTGATDFIRAGRPAPTSAFSDPSAEVIAWLAWIYRWTTLDLSTVLFDGAHDLLVEEESARSGLAEPFATRAEWLHGVHTFEVRSWRIEQLVDRVLGHPGGADAAGSPLAPVLPGSGRPPRGVGAGLELPPLPAVDVVTGGITLSLRAEDLPARPGGSVEVSVAAAFGHEPISVRVVTGGETRVLDASPFRGRLRVPDSAVGEIELRAFAVTGEGVVLTAEPVRVPVRIESVEIGLLVRPSTVLLHDFAPEAPLLVEARWDDGSQRDVTRVEGTSFESLDSAIVDVDPETGRLRALAAGRAVVRVRRGGRARDVLVEVRSTPGDGDGDGRIDARDLGLLEECFSGDREAPGFVRPSLECRDRFDLDHDGDIDCADAERLGELWTEPTPPPLPLLPCAGAGVAFSRGDADASGAITITDAVAILGHLFLGERRVPCLDAADTDDSGRVDIADAVAILDWLFRGGRPPNPPFTTCGSDPTDDGLGCEGFAACGG